MQPLSSGRGGLLLPLLLALLHVAAWTPVLAGPAVSADSPPPQQANLVVEEEDFWGEEEGEEWVAPWAAHAPPGDDALPIADAADATGSSEAHPPLTKRPFFDLARLRAADFTWEILCLLVIGVAAHWYRRGRDANTALAIAWRRALQPRLVEQFARVGRTAEQKGSDSSNSMDTQAGRLVRDGPADFLLTATGRANVEQLTLHLRLQPRQDVVTHLFRLYQPTFGRMRDSVEMTAWLPKEQADSLCLALLPKRRVATLLKGRWDLDTFPRPLGTRVIQDSMVGCAGEYVVLTDAPVFTQGLWEDAAFQAALRRLLGRPGMGMLQSLILSDLPPTKPETEAALFTQPRRLTLTYHLPPNAGLHGTQRIGDGDDEDLADLIQDSLQVLLDVADCVGEAGRLGPEDLARTRKVREAARQQIAKVEVEARKQVLADKKVAERKARVAEAVATMSPEELRRFEERTRRRDLKREQKKALKKGRISLLV